MDEEERVVWATLVDRLRGDVVEEERVIWLLLLDVLLVEMVEELELVWLVLLVFVEDVVRLEDVLELELKLRPTLYLATMPLAFGTSI